MIWSPLIAGLVLAFIAPWVRFLGAYVATRPISKLRQLQFSERHAQKLFEIEKSKELELKEAERIAQREELEIEAARRLAEARDTGEGEAAEQIEQLRAQSLDDQPIEEVMKSLSGLEDVSIRILGLMEEPERISDIALKPATKRLLSEALPNVTFARAQVELENSFRTLKDKGLAETDSYNKWRLTSPGYRIYDLS